MAPKQSAAEKAAEEAERDEQLTYVVSMEDTTVIIFDWAGIVEVASQGDPLAEGVRGLRAFALPKGFATHS
eukprot:5481867-Pleurochrysis_carterae.AAC.1